MAERKEAKHELTTEKPQWQDKKLSFMVELKWEKQERTKFDAVMKLEIANLTIALMESKDSLMNNGVQWQQAKSKRVEETETSKQLYMSQIDKEKKANNHLMPALRKTEEHFESLRSEWKEEGSSLLRATRDLKGDRGKKRSKRG